MQKFFRGENGQIFIWLALVVPLLILFSATALDIGLVYKTKAKLGNSVDSAVLTAIKNYSLGITNGTFSPTVPQGLGQDMFYANLGTACNNGAGTICTWTWCPGATGCAPGVTNVTLAATTPQHTTFMAYWPNWATWTVGDTAQAIRSTLLMTLILDRSGSMASNGGQQALQSAVPQFVGYFTQGTDYIGLVSFASSATTDVALSTNFSTAITQDVSGMNFVGGTFGGGAGSNTCTGACQTTYGPPLNMADYQNNHVSLPAGTPETKVVVYFTDGQMNTVQDALACTNAAAIASASGVQLYNGGVLYNYGGFDPTNCNTTCQDPSAGTYDFFNAESADSNYNDQPPTGNDLSWWYANGGSGSGTQTCPSSGGGSVGLCGPNPPWSGTLVCQGVTKMPTQLNGGTEAFTWSNITNETKYRAVITANAMQAETPVPTYIYVIGLGDIVTNLPGTEQFLSTLANDPAGPATYGCGTGVYSAGNTNNCYNPALTQGAFLIVPDCPGAQCTAELERAFQTIASLIRLRLSE
jgi:Flp pilus assembly protein TadG